MATKAKEYQVQARVNYLVTATVMASSLEEATTKALALKEEAFVEVLGDCIDSDFRITGLYESEA